MIYVLYWGAPALVLAGLATGVLRASRTVAALSGVVALLLVVDTVLGERARAAGASCDTVATCADPATNAIAAVLAVAALTLPHLVGRWMRAGIERAWARDGAHLML